MPWRHRTTRYSSAPPASGKSRSNKPRAGLTFPVDQFDDPASRRMGLEILPILPAHAIAAAALPRHHGDPFDRMLVAQTIVENLELVSGDETLAQYDVRMFGVA